MGRRFPGYVPNIPMPSILVCQTLSKYNLKKKSESNSVSLGNIVSAFPSLKTKTNNPKDCYCTKKVETN